MQVLFLKHCLYNRQEFIFILNIARSLEILLIYGYRSLWNPWTESGQSFNWQFWLTNNFKIYLQILVSPFLEALNDVYPSHKTRILYNVLSVSTKNYLLSFCLLGSSSVCLSPAILLTSEWIIQICSWTYQCFEQWVISSYLGIMKVWGFLCFYSSKDTFSPVFLFTVPASEEENFWNYIKM